MKCNLTQNQLTELFSLCFWHGSMKYFIERNSPKADYYEAEYKRYHENIVFCFEMCDRLNVPFWVQNTVLAASDTYEKYYFNGQNKSDLAKYLAKYNITVNP